LRKSSDSVHRAGKDDGVPMNSCCRAQPIGDVNADPMALDGFDGRPVYAAVISPASCAQPRREFVIDFLGDQVKNLDSVDDLERECYAIRRDDWIVILTRFTRWWRVVVRLVAGATGAGSTPRVDAFRGRSGRRRRHRSLA